jgi:uncharacterized membrane protein YccF (DUF307 family)
MKLATRVLTIGLLCGVLLMSGCRRQEVNDYSVFKYGAGDDVCEMSLKTAGNVLPWMGEGVVYASFWALIFGWRALLQYLASRS